MQIRKIKTADFDAIWPMIRDIVRTEETYAFDPAMDKAAAFEIWINAPLETYVLETQTILGSYFIKANASGPGSHVCNCGYMVFPEARGQGVATKLCIHSQQVAVELGFRAMQFNSVVSTNTVAVNLWKKLGFEVIGTVPKGFRHRRLGFVDTFVMYKWLEQ